MLLGLDPSLDELEYAIKAIILHANLRRDIHSTNGLNPKCYLPRMAKSSALEASNKLLSQWSSVLAEFRDVHATKVSG